jgi:hypothetical protein
LRTETFTRPLSTTFTPSDATHTAKPLRWQSSGWAGQMDRSGPPGSAHGKCIVGSRTHRQRPMCISISFTVARSATVQKSYRSTIDRRIKDWQCSEVSAPRTSSLHTLRLRDRLWIYGKNMAWELLDSHILTLLLQTFGDNRACANTASIGSGSHSPFRHYEGESLRSEL